MTKILKASEVPSDSTAAVTDGKLDYAHVYGDQRLERLGRNDHGTLSAGIGQQAVHRRGDLHLVEEGKMSLDDKVAKYFPTLTDANTAAHPRITQSHFRLPRLLAAGFTNLRLA